MSLRERIVAFFSRETKDTSLPVYFGSRQQGGTRRGWINATHEVGQMRQGKSDLDLPASQWVRPDQDYTMLEPGVTDERGTTVQFWGSKYQPIETNTGPEPGPAPYEPWPGSEGGGPGGGGRPYQPWPGEEDHR